MKTLTASLPRMFACYNAKGFDFNTDLPVIPWQNCGHVHEAMRLPTPHGGWCMLDREVYEHDRMSLVHEWHAMSFWAGPGPLIAYDPFGWDPAELRVAGWWLRMKGWMGFGHAAAHMASRRTIAQSLDGFDAWATDVYPATGYGWDQYHEWAMLKVNAHMRVCAEFRAVPVVFLNLGLNLELQARIVRVADKRIRWGLWQDPVTWEDAAMHAQATRVLAGLIGGVTQ